MRGERERCKTTVAGLSALERQGREVSTKKTRSKEGVFEGREGEKVSALPGRFPLTWKSLPPPRFSVAH